jgi:hypothetical protein
MAIRCLLKLCANFNLMIMELLVKGHYFVFIKTVKALIKRVSF